MNGPGSKAIPAMRWSAASMLVRSGLALVQLLIVARLLEPHEFGALAIVLAVQGLVLLVSDLGLSAAIIHFPRLGETERSTLFWMNFGAAIFLSGLVAALAPALAIVFDDPALVGLVLVLAPVLVLSAPWQHLRAIGEKDLSFTLLARTEIIAAGLGFLGTVTLAFAGVGATSVVIGALITATASSLLGWVLLDPRWRPHLVFRPGAVNKHLRYGLHCVAIGFSNAVGMQGDVLIAAHAFPSSALGYYHPPREIGLRAMLVINPIITRVSFPLIARAQNTRGQVAAIYGRTVLLTASTCFPVYAAMALFAPQLAEIALGPKWTQSVPLFQALALWCALRSVGNPVGALLLGVGRTQLAFALSASTAVLVIVSAWLGAQWGGLAGVPLALAILYAALIVPVWWLAIRPASGLGFAAYHGLLVRPAVCTAVAALAGAWATSFRTGAVAQLSAGLLMGGAVYVLASAAFNRGFIDELGQLTFMARAEATP